MALLRMIYDSIVILTFYFSGVYMYYRHKNYEYSTHPLTVITCKIGAIILILLSVNLFFSNYVNNFIYIIHMKDLGLQRYIKEETADIEQQKDKVQNATIEDTSKDQTAEASVDQAVKACVDQAVEACVDQVAAASVDQAAAATVDQAAAASEDQAAAASEDQAAAASEDQAAAASEDQGGAASAVKNKAYDPEQEAKLPNMEETGRESSQ